MCKVAARSNNAMVPATVQVDVDGLGILLAHHGLPDSDEPDFILSTALPRFASLFARHGVTATFFVVGRDLTDPHKAELLRSLAEAGHEVGNHTMSHPAAFSALGRRAQEAEVRQCEDWCASQLGVTPVGFRAPNYDVDARTLEVLTNLGYRYDSSVMPMPYAPLLRWCSARIAGGKQLPGRYLGRARYGLAPLRPYTPAADSVWRRGAGGITEVPITTMPFLRLPFHASFSLAWRSLGGGDSLFRLGYQWARRHGLPLNYVFHACELADVPPDDRLRRHWGLYLPLAERLASAEAMLAAIVQDYEVMPTCRLVERLEGGPRG